MTAAEKALYRISKVSRSLVVSDTSKEQPVTWLISGCHWPEAIAKINEAINDLNEARALLAPLAENRPRD